MGVDGNCKQEGNGGETSSSVVDTCSTNASSTVAKTDQIPITGQSNTLKREAPSAETESSTVPVQNACDVGISTVQPASKRIKVENEETTTSITAESKNVAVVGVSDSGVGISSSVQPKAPLATGTTTSVPISQTQSGMSNPVASSPASAAVDASTTATVDKSGTNKPQHAITPTIANGKPQQSDSIAAVPASASADPAAQVNENIPVKIEASSVASNSNQGGASSVVTASVGSSPQHTSQSSSASADSSNGSLHDSETNRSAVASAPPTTSIKNPPSASRESVKPATAGAAVPAARPQNLKSPPLQASNPTPRPQTNLPVATTKSTAARPIPPPSKPAPPQRSHIPPASATPATAHPVSKGSTNAEVPLKSLNFGHLRIKYLGELEYMLREFRKLERQLLGAKGAQQLEESQGSRERREKLHSFILHLEDTIRQIELGCKLETDGTLSAAAAGNGNDPAGEATTAAEEAKKQLAQESALSNLTKEKEEEETVQKLEEHILANLLPVKVRLKKQLAAQQGATQNPPGMPAMRRGTLQPSSTTRGKGTFVEAAEKKRKHAESLRLAAQAQHERQARREVSDPTQFGKPLSGVGSSLTKKLHGSTLGSNKRRTGHGVGSSSVPKEVGERKILHAGMVPKSTQQKSGLSAASGVHDIVSSSAQNSNTPNNNPATAALAASLSAKPAPAQPMQASTKTSVIAGKQKQPKVQAKAAGAATKIDTASQNKQVVASSSAPMSEEERLKYKKHRRLRKLKRLKRRRERELARQQLPKSQQHLPNNTLSASNAAVGRKKVGHGKVGQKKKGPRVVEYICSQCSETYTSTCELNPWWALAQHKCPKCGKTQIPRIDITSPANTIEYHPALLSHLEDGGRGGAGSIPASSAQPIAPTMPVVSQIPDGANSINSESDSDLSELSDDNISIGSLKAAELESELQSMTPGERAEHETFGKEYEGPVLADEHSAKLLILMSHASTCPCQHKSEKHREVCRATKYMMLHVRDCPGTTATGDVCPFPWCRKVKHLLYHLVSTEKPDQCSICTPKNLPKGYEGLMGLNAHRTKKYRERLIAKAKARLVAKNAKANPTTKKQSTTKRASSATQGSNARKAPPDTKVPVAQPNPAVQRPAPPPAAVPVKQETVNAPAPTPAPTPAPAPYISSTTNVASVDTGVVNINPLGNTVETQAHPAMTQPSTEDFDVDAEIAKLESVAADLNEACAIVPVKEESSTQYAIPEPVEAPVPYAMESIPEVEANPTVNNYSTIPAPDIPAPDTTNDHVLPTPVAAIQMDEHDADAAELSDLLATNTSSEDHAIGNPVQQDDLGDISEYLKNDDQMPPQHPPPQGTVMVTEHQAQIDMESGVPDALQDPISDPLANMNHEITYESSDLLVPAPTTVELKEDYSEVVSAISAPQQTPDVSTVPATTSDVEKAVGSVAVN